ncbi:MAG: ketol-acid reductoisomerase [Promethearchaeota archaeon]|nr:MAG: ketol-acid reductoisomerase [Candidatus Lokiarchaeota archaeon]
MTKIYYEKDGNLDYLKNKTIGMIGYGNQGRSQALNMRDSGLNVIVGNRADEYWERAKNDGFQVFSIEEAVKKSDFLFLLIPDEIMENVFQDKISPNLKKNQSLIFASGYNIGFNILIPPDFIDLLLIAPRMIGIGVRERFLNQKGYFSFIAVEQDASGHAKDNLLGLCKALGTLKKGAIEVSFKEEAILDLFTEQGFGPAFGRVLLETMGTILDADYPVESALIEILLSGQLKSLYRNIIKYGLSRYIEAYPKRTQYGILKQQIKYKNTGDKIAKIQKNVIENIASGEFAEEWEGRLAKIKFKVIKYFAPRVGFARNEKSVRKKLGFSKVDLFAETPYPTNDELKERERIFKELEDFNHFPEY